MKARQAGVAFVLVSVFLDMLGIGLVAPVLPKVILGFLGGDIARASNSTGAFLTTFAVNFSPRRRCAACFQIVLGAVRLFYFLI